MLLSLLQVMEMPAGEIRRFRGWVETPVKLAVRVQRSRGQPCGAPAPRLLLLILAAHMSSHSVYSP